MRKIAVLAMAVALSGCAEVIHIDSALSGPQIVGSGKVSTVTRKLGTFKSVSIDGSIDADVTVGKATDAVIKGDDNLITLVKTEVRDGTLHIFLDKNYTTHNGIEVTLGAGSLDGAKVQGSGDLAVHKVSGSAFALSIAGSGDVKADGSTEKLAADVSGSGNLNLYDLNAKDATVGVTGSGDAQVNVSGNLTASVTGSGDISYRGNPHVTKSITGSGDVSAG